MVLSEELCILSSCFLSPMSKNSVLEELRVRRLVPQFLRLASERCIFVGVCESLSLSLPINRIGSLRPTFIQKVRMISREVLGRGTAVNSGVCNSRVDFCVSWIWI